MREAKIICPLHDNEGKGLPHVISGVRSALINAFCGCTEYMAQGSWADDRGKLYSEPVMVFCVACPDNAETRDVLDAIAEEIGYKAKQESVYVQYADGTVVIKNTAKYWRNDAAERNHGYDVT